MFTVVIFAPLFTWRPDNQQVMSPDVRIRAFQLYVHRSHVILEVILGLLSTRPSRGWCACGGKAPRARELGLDLPPSALGWRFNMLLHRIQFTQAVELHWSRRQLKLKKPLGRIAAGRPCVRERIRAVLW
jgi:hypothetical protein